MSETQFSAKEIFSLFKDTGKEWQDDKVPKLAAALAYYTVFSIAPTLIIAIAVAGLVFGKEAAQGQIVGQLQGIIGSESAREVQNLIQSASKPTSGIVATILGIATLLFGATAVFGELQDSLNTIWGVKPKPGRSFWTAVRERLLSFTMVLSIGFILLVSLVLSAFLSGFNELLNSFFPSLSFVAQFLNALLSFGVVTLLFAFIYKVLPDVVIRWKDVWMGALMTALLFTLGKFLIGLYIGKTGTSSAYGAAGSFAVLLLWVYYSSHILFFGAELTQVYCRKFGSGMRPSHNAVPLDSFEHKATKQS